MFKFKIHACLLCLFFIFFRQRRNNVLRRTHGSTDSLTKIQTELKITH